ncbi:hypothetical protein DZG03_05335 [Clavibacter phaseoli]|nr:hypothetical protein DZG03_05335 [Clavibacter phaseoli]
MLSSPDPFLPPRARARHDIELMMAVAWNADGATRGLQPLSWQIGADDFVHFIASADAHAHGCRRPGDHGSLVGRARAQ